MTASEADPGKRFACIEATGSRTVHLAVLSGDGVESHALCGRVVTCHPPATAVTASGCPDCALEAINRGVAVVRTGNRMALCLEGQRFEF